MYLIDWLSCHFWYYKLQLTSCDGTDLVWDDIGGSIEATREKLCDRDFAPDYCSPVHVNETNSSQLVP